MYLKEYSTTELQKYFPLVERQALYFVHVRIKDWFVGSEKIMAEALRRAQGCGCRNCWRDYERLCVEYGEQYAVPDEDGCPDEIRMQIERYAPDLDTNKKRKKK